MTIGVQPRLRITTAILTSFLLLACGAITLGFPSVDRDKLTITLQRSACYGLCPDYSVTIHGDGRVVFSTGAEAIDAVSTIHRTMSFSRGVLVPGRHEDRIDTAAVDALVQEFREVHFFSLRNEYRAEVTDSPTYVLMIDTGNGRKTVVDYVGESAGMPPAVTQLEDDVDRVARTARWITGGEGLVEALAETGFDFHSAQASELAVNGVRTASDTTLVALVERGAPLDLRLSDFNASAQPADRVGSGLLRDAIRYGKTGLFEALIQRGWRDRLGLPAASRVFAQSGAGCSPAMVDVAIAAGVTVDPPPARQRPMDHADLQPPSLDDARESSALANLAASYLCRDEPTRVATAARLLAHGADPNRRNTEGKTAIFGVENMQLLNLLLDRGADPRVLDVDGNSAVFETWTDAIVLRLLQSGASPVGHYFDGSTLDEQTRRRSML